MEKLDTGKLEECELSMGSSSIIEILENQILLRNFLIENIDLFNLLKDRPEEERGNLLREIIDIGTLVYQRVQASSEIDFVKRHFDSFAAQLETKILNLETAFQTAVISSLSLEEDGSAAKKLLVRFNELHEGVKSAVMQARKELQEDQTRLKEDIGKAFQEDGRLGQLLKQISEFERKVAERLNPNDKTSFFGQILEELKGYFEPGSGKVSSLLDSRLSFDNPESPFYQFSQGVREDISKLRGEIEAYRTALLGEEKLRAEKERGTKKGFDFEDELEAALHELAHPFGDEVERVSEARKPGDFIYILKGGWRVAIDAKDESMTSLPKYKRILDEAMDIWGANYGIILAKDPSQLQPQVGEWNEYDGNKLITCLPYLRVSLNWVRLRQVMAVEIREGVDIEGITQETEKVKAALRSLKEVRKQLTTIQTARDSIITHIDRLEMGVLGGIEEILKKIGTETVTTGSQEIMGEDQ